MMRVNLSKPRLHGVVAIINLALIGMILLTFLVAFPGGVVDQDTTSRNGLLLASTLEILLAVLSFPLGWLSLLFRAGVSGPPWAAVIFVPLNAYLWGYIAAAVVNWRKTRLGRDAGANKASERS